MPVVLETEQLHLLSPWLGLSQPWCLLIRARSDHGRERAKEVGTTLRSSPLRGGFSIQPPSPLSMQAQKRGHSHHHDEEKLTGAAAAYGRAPKAKKFATCEKAEPRDGLPVVPTLVRVEPELLLFPEWGGRPISVSESLRWRRQPHDRPYSLIGDRGSERVQADLLWRD